MNKFGQALISGKTLITAQCLPPAGTDTNALQSLAQVLPSTLDAVIVADNPDRIRSSALSAAVYLNKQLKTSVVLSMTTRDRNRLALMSDALGAAALDIEAILCVSGQHQSLGLCEQAASANDLDSIQFIQALKKMVLYGAGMSGKELGTEIKLQVGAAAHPYMRPMGLNILRLKKKVAVGADFLLTQAVFDKKGFVEWLDAARDLAFDKRTAIIASVLPFPSVQKAKELQHSQLYGPIPDEVIERIGKAEDPAHEGVVIAAEMAQELKAMPGIRGINILCGGYESLAKDVIQQAKL
jgi:methylenetetrahydrofolate reductase (NADPH)